MFHYASRLSWWKCEVKLVLTAECVGAPFSSKAKVPNGVRSRNTPDDIASLTSVFGLAQPLSTPRPIDWTAKSMASIFQIAVFRANIGPLLQNVARVVLSSNNHKRTLHQYINDMATASATSTALYRPQTTPWSLPCGPLTLIHYGPGYFTNSDGVGTNLVTPSSSCGPLGW